MTEVQPIEAADTEKIACHLTTEHGTYSLYDVAQEKVRVWTQCVKTNRGFTAKGFGSNGQALHFVFAPAVVNFMRMNTYVG